MAAKRKAKQAPQNESAVDVTIAAFRAAHAEWHRAIPGIGASIAALDAEGNSFTRSYWLPSGAYFEAETAEAAAPFGFAKPEWSSRPQPILRPTNEEWRAAHDACAAARVALAGAADQLAAVVDGTESSATQLRRGALLLAAMLRDIPPVWPTNVETKLAFEINNNLIVEFQQAINEARRRSEAAEAAATEERRKTKAEQMADLLIKWDKQKRAKEEHVAPPRKPRVDNVDREIIVALRNKHGPMTPAEIGREMTTQLEESARRKRLRKLATLNEIKRNKSGLYWHPTVTDPK